jgi:hypothetical protein
MNEKGLMEQSNAAIKAALELYAAAAHYEDGNVFYKIANGIGRIFPIGGHTTRSRTTIESRKVGGNTATSTRTRFTTTGLTGLLLVGCLCHRRK